MRCIDFRIYNKKENCYYYSSSKEGLNNSNKDLWGIIEIYTGIIDDYDKKIYQNDICEISFNVNEIEDWVFCSLSEKEKTEGKKTFIVESPIFNNQTEFLAKNIKVIGNVWNNQLN